MTQRLTRGWGTQPSREGEKWKNSCLCSKAADSPLFFQLRTAATNSAYSMLAYGNKAVCEITTGIFTPSPSPHQKLCLVRLLRLWQSRCFLLAEMITLFSLTFINCLVVKTESKSLQRTLPIWRALHVPTPFHAVLSAVSTATLWLLLWRCQPCQNKGRAETK